MPHRDGSRDSTA